MNEKRQKLNGLRGKKKGVKVGNCSGTILHWVITSGRSPCTRKQEGLGDMEAVVRRDVRFAPTVGNERSAMLGLWRQKEKATVDE